MNNYEDPNLESDKVEELAEQYADGEMDIEQFEEKLERVSKGGGDGADLTNHELRQMSDEEARQSLTVDEYERREKLIELHEQADETRERWAEEERQIAEITVQADMEQLGTRVDVFGNDLLVHLDSDDRQLTQAAGKLEDLREQYADVDADELEELPTEDKNAMLGHLQTMLDCVIVEWGDQRWSNLREDQRADILADAAEKWGLDGIMLAWVDIAAAVNEDRQERMEVVESFQ